MDDPGRPFSETKDEVVVLRPFKPRSETFQLPDQRHLVTGQMSGVHTCFEVLRGPVRFEERLESFTTRRNFVLVAVDHVDVAMGVDDFCELQKGVRGNFVVVVNEHQVVSGGEPERRVRGLRDVPILLAKCHAYSAVPLPVLLQYRPNARIG